MMDMDILTIKEVSAYLKITEKTTYRLASEGDSGGLRFGGASGFGKRKLRH
jgi:excisionase family DNA binding protein